MGQNSLDNSFLGSKWLNPDYLFNQGLSFFQDLFHNLGNISPQIVSIYHGVLFFAALFFIMLLSYSIIRVMEIRSKEKKHLRHEIEEYAHHQAEKQKKAQEGEAVSRNPRWLKTLDHLFSQHQSDWKLAVIEADSMLEALLVQLGFKGETLGDKLKSADQTKFKNLTSAWEVHTIRNKIAHEGAAFHLSQHEAKRVIAIYESIFREFGFI